MIDPQEFEAAAKDIMQRTGHSTARIEFGVLVHPDGQTRSYFYAQSGSSSDYDCSSERGDSLDAAVECCIDDVKHKRRTELEKAREKVRLLESQAA